MIEVAPFLFVGDSTDYAEKAGALNWAFVQAAKDPWHRAAVGYKSLGCPKDSPEYLFAYRGDRLILNMVDTDDPKYFAKEMIDEALEYIWDRLDEGCRVLVHCNQGESRGPSIALLYLRVMDPEYWGLTVSEAAAKFVGVYPKYNPKAGILGFMERHWEQYQGVAQPE